MRPVALDLGVVAHAAQQAVGDARRAARALRDARRALGVDGHAEDAGRARHDALELGDGIELEALHDAEAIAQRRGQQARARGRADQRERLQRELDRTRRRPFADHDVELEVLHRRIQHFLDHGREPMDLVDEQHVARLQVGQQRGEIAGPFEHRARGLAQVHAQLAGEDVGERGLAEAGRAEDQRVIQRLAALDRRLHEDLHLRLDLFLADVVGEPLRADGAIDGLLFARSRGLHDAIVAHSFGRFIAAAPRPAARGGSGLRWSLADPANGLSICVTSAGL